MALRMRTVKQCIEHFKDEDPETSLTEYYINGLVKQEKIPVFYAGRKRLVNLDKLIEYLNSEAEEEQVPTIKDYGRIRRVGE